MKTPVTDYLDEIRTLCDAGEDGTLADYIPELAAVDPERFALAVCMRDGVVYATGDADVEFTIQSMSKPFVYALALRDRGIDAVLAKVCLLYTSEAADE